MEQSSTWLSAVPLGFGARASELADRQETLRGRPDSLRVTASEWLDQVKALEQLLAEVKAESRSLREEWKGITAQAAERRVDGIHDAALADIPALVEGARGLETARTVQGEAWLNSERLLHWYVRKLQEKEKRVESYSRFPNRGYNADVDFMNRSQGTIPLS